MNLRELADRLTLYRSGFTTSEKEDEEVISEAEGLIKEYVRKKCAEQRQICYDNFWTEKYMYRDGVPEEDALELIANAEEPNFKDETD